MYGCLGWVGRSVYGDSSPYLTERACVTGTATNATSACGFVNVGACELACENHNRTGSGPYDEIWEDCWSAPASRSRKRPSSARKFPFVITVYLPAAR